MGLETAAIMAIASTAVTAGTAIYGGMQEKKAADANAKQVEAEGEFNRKQQEADAKAEKDAADIRASQIREAGKRQRSETRAALAGAGVDVGEGTAIDLQTSVTEAAEKDAQMSIFGGLDAFKRGNQTAQSIGIRAENESSALKAQGKAARTAGFIGAGKAIAGGYGDYKATK